MIGTEKKTRTAEGMKKKGWEKKESQTGHENDG